MKHIIEANPLTPLPQVKSVRVDDDSAGQRLDNFLMRQLKGVPKAHVYRIIRSGEVRLNKRRAGADTRVAAGDTVRLPPLRLSARASDKAQAMAQGGAPGTSAPARDFAALLEDAHLLAIDKPAGVAVHGGSGVSFGVIEQLRMARPQAQFLELVHRLDRETSGILLVAKKRSALRDLQEQFRQRTTDKTYLALVAGAWPAHKKVLDKPLHKYLLDTPDGSAGERRVKAVSRDDPDGMAAITLVKVAQRMDALYTLLEVRIKTGRTHQIRVHLASEGYPIVGDDKYGDFELNKRLQRPTQGPALKRMFLHAWQLQFKHPQGGAPVVLTAPLPAELRSFLDHHADARDAAHTPV